MTSPAAGSTYTEPASINLAASAADTDGTVVRVEFFAGATKIGETQAAPHQITWTGVPAGTYSLTARATDNTGASAVSAPVAVTVNPDISGPSNNAALAANGAVATASSAYSSAYLASTVNDGIRNGGNWGAGGGWNDATSNGYPDWVQIDFGGLKSINRINVITLADNYAAGVDPTPTTTFSNYGITSFDVQYWTGLGWATVPGGAITGNNLVVRSVSFPTVSTSRIRVVVNSALYDYSRIVEIEAWNVAGANALPTVSLTSPAAGSTYTEPASINLAASAADTDGTVVRVEFFAGATKIGETQAAPHQITWTGVPAGTYSLTARATDNTGASAVSAPVAVTVNPDISGPSNNAALAANGAVATASSAYSSAYLASTVNDGIRNGGNWGAGGGWNDATSNGYPDWVQIDFGGLKSINRINVITLADNYAAGVDPTPTTTFSNYGITSFDVQYWTGLGWATVPGGAITGNNLVVRSVSFPTVSTSRIRVVVNSALYDYSRIVEIEAWNVAGANALPTVSLTSPAAGSTYTEPASISLAASAADTDGTVVRVEFFAGATKIGETQAAPHQITWTGVPAGTYSLTARATDNTGASAVSAPVAVTVNPDTSGPSINAALSANGAVATASSAYSSAYLASTVNDGIRNGGNWGAGGGWNDATRSIYSDWVQIDFGSLKSINRINVITLADNYAAGVDPTPTTTFSNYGITSFDVQYWTGLGWATVPGGAITGNNLVVRSVSFPTVSTSRIRVVVNSALYDYSRIVEIEAWTD